jgi:putative hydrolase of the HAD superfamily
VPNWNVILFDLDDTLFSEREFARSGFAAIAASIAPTLAMPEKQVCQELTAVFEECPRARVFDTWCARRGLDDPALCHRMIDIYRHHAPKIQLRPGMRPLLEDLRKSKRLGLVSDGLMSTQQNKLAALGIISLFHTIVLSDQWGREYWKPHVRPFQAALHQLGSSATEAVYVADNPLKDFRGCRSLQMASIRLRFPDGIYADIEPPTSLDEATRTVHSIEELAAALVGE